MDDRRLAPVVRVVIDDHDLEADVPGRVQDGAHAPERVLAAVHVDDDDGELVHALWWVRETSKMPATMNATPAHRNPETVSCRTSPSKSRITMYVNDTKG